MEKLEEHAANRGDADSDMGGTDDEGSRHSQSGSGGDSSSQKHSKGGSGMKSSGQDDS